MASRRNDILQGTLALLVLKSLATQGKLHGYAITAYIQRASAELLRVEEGSLYPALHRMEHLGWITAARDISPIVLRVLAVGRQHGEQLGIVLTLRQGTRTGQRCQQGHGPCEASPS